MSVTDGWEHWVARGGVRPWRKMLSQRLRTSVCDFAIKQTGAMMPFGDAGSSRTVSEKFACQFKEQEVGTGPESKKPEGKPAVWPVFASGFEVFVVLPD